MAARTGSVPVTERWRAFVGRERELRTLAALLAQAGAPPVTITGIPGIGKTRLAQELVRRSSAWTGAGAVRAVFVSLAETERPDAIGTVVAAARERRLRDRTAAGATAELLVLDDVGHLAGADEQIDALTRSGDVRVLATSPRPLGLPGERVLRLGALADDDDVALFVGRAQAVDPHFDASDPGVAELCTLLGGIPLAIELAAARAGAFRPAALAAQLRDGAGLAALRAPGAARGPERHRGVAEALTWSCRLLTPPQQDLLAAVSVFAGSFSVAGAAAVGEVTKREAYDALCALADCHLVEPLAGGTMAGRFAVHRLVRRFSGERLVETGRERAVEERHTALVRRIGRDAAAAYDRGEHAAALALLEHEWPEVAAALARLSAEDRVEDALALAADTAPYLLSVGVDAGGLERLERLIEAARRREPDGAADLTRALLWSAILTRLVARPAPDPRWVAARLAEGLARARAADEETTLLLGLELTALAVTVTGDVAGGWAAVEEGMARSGERGDDGRLARFAALGCMLAQQRGDPAQASRLGESAVRRALRRGDEKATLLAAVAVLGLPEQAAESARALLPAFDELVALARSARDRHAEGFLLAVESSRRLLAADDAGAAALCVDHLELLLARDEATTIGLGFSISTLVVLAARRASFARAGRLDGSLDRLGDAVALPATPAKRAALAEAQAAGRAALGERRWAQERRSGAALTAHEAAVIAIAYAREITESEISPETALRPRERDVLRGLAAGKSNKAIAAELGITPKTVMHYTSSIYRKLGVDGRAGAAAWAVASGAV